MELAAWHSMQASSSGTGSKSSGRISGSVGSVGVPFRFDCRREITLFALRSI
jgi:hypothetical protein